MNSNGSQKTAIDMKVAKANAEAIKHFVPRPQLRTIYQNVAGEEGEYFYKELQRIKDLVESMPKVYEQEGQGDNAKVYLHYFGGSADFYITERDISPEQLQAFGWASYGHGEGEWGYICLNDFMSPSFPDLLSRRTIELDQHFPPVTVGELKLQGKIY